MGFPLDSHGNWSSFGLLMGIKIVMGIVLIGMRIAYFIGKKIKFPSLSTGSVNSLLFFCTVTCSDSLINVEQ